MKQYEKLSIRDHFMFGKLCQDIKNSQMILSALFNEDIHLKKSDVEKYLQEDKGTKFIRLDLLAQDDVGTIYNAELQHISSNVMRQRELPFRSRYYQALIDSTYVSSGLSYLDIPETYVIFICTYDPFGKGLPVYTIKSLCVETSLEDYTDKANKLFFNTTADLNSLPQATQNMLNYINKGIVNDDATKHLDRVIQNAIKKELWKEDYMLTYVHDKDVYREGYDSRQSEVDELNRKLEVKDETIALLQAKLESLSDKGSVE